MIFKKKSDLEMWLSYKKIYDYRIDKDLVVHVDNHVSLEGQNLKQLPCQFGRVEGSFDVSHNSLVSLKGSPYHVGLAFKADKNQLKTLEYLPNWIGQDLFLSDNSFTSLLEFNPKLVIQGELSLQDNLMLTHLQGAPKKVKTLSLDAHWQDKIGQWPGVIEEEVYFWGKFREGLHSFGIIDSMEGQEVRILHEKLQFEAALNQLSPKSLAVGTQKNTTFKI